MRTPIAAFSLLIALASSSAGAGDLPAAVVATPVLKTTEAWDGRPIVFPTDRAEVTALSIVIPPGAETGWHQHPVPSFAFVVEGELQVTLRDGRTRRFRAGEAFAEVVATAHNGRNAGAVPTRLLVLYAGSAGTPLTVKQ